MNTFVYLSSKYLFLILILLHIIEIIWLKPNNVFLGPYCGDSVLLDISVCQVFNLNLNFNDKFQF